jgi:hypothetical protein
MLSDQDHHETGGGVALKALGPEAARLFDEHLRSMEERTQTAQKLWVPAKWLVLLALLSVLSTIFYILDSLATALW